MSRVRSVSVSSRSFVTSFREDGSERNERILEFKSFSRPFDESSDVHGIKLGLERKKTSPFCRTCVESSRWKFGFIRALRTLTSNTVLLSFRECRSFGDCALVDRTIGFVDFNLGKFSSVSWRPRRLETILITVERNVQRYSTSKSYSNLDHNRTLDEESGRKERWSKQED